MIRSASIASVLMATVCATLPAQARPEESADTTAPAPKVIEANLAEMRQLVRAGIDTKTPSANLWRRKPGATLFDGSYDWHSCIAAHWAGLSMARLLPDAALATDLLARLSPEAMAAERAFRTSIDNVPHPFTPYVDAWTLLLLDELRKHPDRATEDLAAFRLETETRLLDHLEKSPFPESQAIGDTQPPVVMGSYRSWLFGYLALRIAGTRGDGTAARLETIAAAKLDPHRELMATYHGRQSYDFFDVRSLYWLVTWFEGGERRPAAAPAVEFTPLPASVTIRTVHVVGLCASECWPAAIMARDDAAARERFEARTAEILHRRDLWADDFAVASHWMPQFLWFGVWLARGQP